MSKLHGQNLLFLSLSQFAGTSENYTMLAKLFLSKKKTLATVVLNFPKIQQSGIT